MSDMTIAVLIDLKEYLPDDEPYNETYVQSFVGRFARLTSLPHTPLVRQKEGCDRWWRVNFNVPQDKVEDFCIIIENFTFVQAELV